MLQKQKRKEAREAKKRAEELAKLKEEIQQKFIDNPAQSANVVDINA